MAELGPSALLSKVFPPSTASMDMVAFQVVPNPLHSFRDTAGPHLPPSPLLHQLTPLASHSALCISARPSTSLDQGIQDVEVPPSLPAGRVAAPWPGSVYGNHGVHASCQHCSVPPAVSAGCWLPLTHVPMGTGVELRRALPH